jgi:hypothetical protein
MGDNSIVELAFFSEKDNKDNFVLKKIQRHCYFFLRSMCVMDGDELVGLCMFVYLGYNVETLYSYYKRVKEERNTRVFFGEQMMGTII